MTRIQNKIITNNSIGFDLINKDNKYKISFSNALRRIFISYIKTYIIDFDQTKFIENNSIFNNEFLKKRLSLIPIYSGDGKIEYSQVMIRCNIKNDNESIKSVYCRDFEVKNHLTGEIIDNNRLLPYPDLLFTKLQQNQFIHFESYLIKNDAFHGGSEYSPVASCLVKFNSTGGERDYQKNKEGAPEIYEFRMDNIGFFNSNEMIMKSFEVLKDKLAAFELKCRNPTFENDLYILHIEDENDTLGNLVASYLLDNEQITFCGYVIEHPLKNNILVKIKTKLKKEELYKAIQEAINNIMSLIKLLEKEF